MRLGLPGLLLLAAWHVPVPTGASYGCSYESLKSTKAMCYMRFHCGTAICPTFARKGPSFLSYFPVCCLHPVIRRNKWYRKRCSYLTKYSVDGRCDPAAHEVVKVDVADRPPRPQPTTTTNNRQPTTNNRQPTTYNLSFCLRYKTSLRKWHWLLRKWPQCCYHPKTYRRQQCACRRQQCAWTNYKRRKREDTESDAMRRWIAEDDGVQDGYNKDMQEAIDAGDTDIPDMKDAKIEVKCCGSGETKSCRGAECFYVCDDPASDTAVDTLDITSSDDTCNPEIIGEDNTGRRKKRGYSAATMASWKINWCPRYVTANRGKWIKWYKICCFHPSVRKHPMAKNGAEGGVANWCHGKSKIFAAWTG